MDLPNKQTRIATLSGGNGHSVLLRGLKNFKKIHISAIVAMTDNGKSSGTLRRELDILPPGDIRQCIGALATKELDLAHTLETRFEKGNLTGHALGNLLIAAMAQQHQSFEAAIDSLHGVFGITNSIIPCTLEKGNLLAELSDGTYIEGEESIDVPTTATRAAIKTISITPTVRANPRALTAVQQADYLIFGPGDFYTSVIPTVLPTGMPQAIQASKGKVVFVSNRTQKFGETHNMNAEQLVDELETYTGRKVDVVVVHNANATPAQHIISFDAAALAKRGARVMAADLADTTDPLRLDGQKVADTIRSLWQQA